MEVSWAKEDKLRFWVRTRRLALTVFARIAGTHTATRDGSGISLLLLWAGRPDCVCFPRSSAPTIEA